MKKLKLIILHSLPFALGIFCSYVFWQQPWLLLILYLILTATIIWFGQDKKTEALIALYGVVAGFTVETIGTQISGYQSFALPQILGIPFWLLISWAYGFVLMKRLGFIIAIGSPWGIK